MAEPGIKNLSASYVTFGSIENHFLDHWDTKLHSQNKLKFYASIKQSFGLEPYLSIPDFHNPKHIAKIRSGAHDLNLEKGRYATKNTIPTLVDKACRYCCPSSRKDNILAALEELPFHITPILESEEHVLTECPAYHHLRSVLSDNLKCLLLLKEYQAIMESYHTKEFGKYLSNCYTFRNPTTKL